MEEEEAWAYNPPQVHSALAHPWMCNRESGTGTPGDPGGQDARVVLRVTA